jgi:signal transduction histidine kinase
VLRGLLRLFSGVRVRVTAAAVLAVACALGVSAAVVDATLQHDRHNVLVTTAQVQAQEVVALNQDFKPPWDLPPTPNLQSGLIQVLHDGRVVAASHALRQKPALWSPGDPMIQTNSDASFGPARDVRIVAVPVTAGHDAATVVVVVSLDQYDKSVGSIQRLLEIGLPILLAVVGLICWVMVGRALRRIEVLRREVAEVAVKPGERRVADPMTDDEVGRLARTLNSMLDRLEASSARERRFVADASHELRSPIANIRTAVEVALHRPEAADWNRVAGEVLVEDGRMAHLVEELLLLARSDEGRLVPSFETCDLLAVARSVVEIGEHAEGPPAVAVSGVAVWVPVPKSYLERIVANLVDNARRFAVAHVDVVVALQGDLAILEIRDDGPGVPADERGRIFERFVRLDEARDREHGGFGLGLAIVADLCHAYGGTIEVTDAAPGAAFLVHFPVAPAPDGREPHPAGAGAAQLEPARP